MAEDFKAISQLQPVELSAVQDEDLILLTKSGPNPKSRTIDIDQLKDLIAVVANQAKVDEFTLKILNSFITLGRIDYHKVIDKETQQYCLGGLARLSRKDLNLGKVAYENYSFMPLTEYNALPKKESNRIYFTSLDKTLFNIDFDYNGGTGPISSKTVQEGQPIGELPEATRSNYYFIGWFTAKDGGNLIISSTIPTKSCTYYAQWMSDIIHYRKVGNIQLSDDKIASNFSDNNYLITTDTLNFGKPISIIIRATTGNNITSNQEIFGMVDFDNYEWGIYNQKCMWEIAGQSTTTGRYKISANTTYWFKVEKNGNLINCYIAEDYNLSPKEWFLDYSITNSTRMNQGRCGFGKDLCVGDNEYWQGTIDVGSSYVEIDNKRFIFQLT